MEDGFLRAVDILTDHFEFSNSFDESKHPREHESHDGKKPGEFAEKQSESQSTSSGDRKTRFNIEVRSAAGKWVYVCWVEAKTTREALKTARGLHEVFSTPGRVARATPAK
jgi:hypothetical protein